MTRLLPFILLVALLWRCSSKNESPRDVKALSVWQTIALKHDTLDVQIPIEGKLVAWKKMEISSPQTARLVSLLVEVNDEVQRGDLLLNLWPVQPRAYGFSPIDVFSPMNGIVRRVYFTLNDTVPAGKVILELENRENLILKATLNRWQLPFIKSNANVRLSDGTITIKGAVLTIDNKNSQISVIVPNRQLKLNKDLYLQGAIELNKIDGDFLPVSVFSNRDSLKALIEGEINLTLFKVGTVGDSLALVSPSLPDLKEVQIEKNLDFIE